MLSGDLAAQSPDWSSVLTISPNASPYLADWERVPSTALLSLTYTGASAADFRVRVSLNSAERGLIGTTESPLVTLAGGPSSFLYNVRDVVFEWTTISRNPSVTDGALKTGQIPEGTYQACARVFVGSSTTPVTEDCAEFSILQPDPPQLLMPQDRDVVVSTQPFFQWTPVLTPPSVQVSYELTVVEVLGMQVPRAALEANIPVFRDVASTPFLIYPIDALQLERTKRYAWRVRAVDAEGRQLFRDGASSEIWTFEMSDDLLRPVGKISDLPDNLVLLPGVAQLTGLRDAKLRRTETEVEVDGSVMLEFLGAAGIKSQRVNVSGLRVGFRGDELSLLEGRIEAAVPEQFIPADIKPFLTFAPLVFTPATGFTASASLKMPGQTAVPLTGTVQLTPGGLFGRLEGARASGFPIARLGRAPVQYAANRARLVLPEGRLEFVGKVLVFEQDIGCAASGAMQNGIVQLPVYCDPTSGFRPDTSSAKSLLTFGTMGGMLAADFLTDTLGADLRAPTVFSVLGDGNRACALEFTMVFVRDSIRREDERSSCGIDEGTADFGWLRLGFRNLRIERLEYVPGATLVWRALVDIVPNVRGADNLQLPTIRDVRLDEMGVSLPSTSSSAPGTSTSGYAELAGIGVLPQTMGFKGGFLTYARWLAGRDPGFEWGSATSWIRFANVPQEVSTCIDAMPFEVDTLIIKGGVLDAALTEKTWDDGCRFFPAENLHLKLRSAGGRVTLALDSVARVTELPVVSGGIIHPKGDCGIPLVGCVDFLNYEQVTGEMRMTPRGRVTGVLSDFKPSWADFDLRFAKLKLAGGTLALGLDTAGAQTAIYDGRVKVSFASIDTTTKDTTAKKDTTVLGTVLAVVGSLFSSGDTTTAPAKLDFIRQRLLSGSIALKGPFKLEIGFVKLIIGEATLDTTGLNIDGRHRTIISRTTGVPKSAASTTPTTTATPTPATRVDSTYTTKDDTVGVTFNKVRVDPSTGDVSAGTVTFDGALALESSPLSAVISVGAAAIGGAVSGGLEGTGQALSSTVTGTGMYGFKLVDATGAFDHTSTFGNIRLNLPSSPTLDAQGMRIDGVAPANAAFAGSRFDSASVAFENGFAMKPASARVTAGRAMLRVRQYPIAYLEPAGWRIALAELVQTIIPDTLFLADRWSAYVVLRDAQRQLLVNVAETQEGPRITTKAGTPVRIVIPALKGSRESAPSALIAMDLTLEKGTWRPLAGEVKAMAGGSAADDFNDIDFPFALDSVIFRAARDAAPSFFAHGRIDIWPGEFKPMRVALGFQGGGEISANVEQPFTDDLPLVNGSALVKFHIDTLRFTAQGKLGSTFQWRLETPGRLAYYDTERQRESVLASATFRLSPTEAALLDFRAKDSLTTIRLPGVDLRLGRIRAPTFRWDFPNKRFDFELLFDVGLQIPALDSLKLPEIRDIRITPQGIVIPAFELASTPATPEQGNPFVTEVQELRVGGFSVKALAYRVSEFRWNWFANAPPPQFNFGVDLEFGVEDLPSGVEGQAARIALRALNVGITNGQLTGTFERIDIPTPIRTPIADIRGAFGSFRVAAGQVPDISIGVLADLRLPDLLACPNAGARMVSLDSPRDTLFIASNGTLRGAIRDVIPRCPMALGPFDLTFGASTARFGFNQATQQVEAVLDASATLRVPGDSPNETVSATGRIVLDIANARVADASIAIDQPFFWAPDPANPFLRLVVSRAALTMQELRFGATGQLRTAEGAGVDVAFENVAFNLNSLRLTSGRIRITAEAAVGIEIPNDGSLRFGVYPVTTPRGTTASARLVLPSGAVIDSAGLHISGTATASLGFGGETYAALAGEFANDFTISTAGRVGITRGRINLRDPSGQLIAYADSVGFWPGNVFAVLPIPARLGIPATDVAYIQLRNPSDTTQLLVETVFGAETVRLRTFPNQKVEVGIPGLANGGPVPKVQAAFDLVLNTRTMRPVSGELLLQSPSGGVLFALAGMPISITQIGFRADTGGFRLKAGARAMLPGPLSDVALEFRDMEVSATGLTGVIELGNYSEVYDPSAVPIVQKALLGDTLSIAFTGAELTIDAANTRVRISGGLRSSLFKMPNGSPRSIALAATIDNQGFRGTADVSDAETPIPIGVASLTLEGGQGRPALVIAVSATEFALTLGGSLRLPTIAPGFSLGVEGMKIGTAGISIPNVSITAPANTKEFDLFGARFALRDSVVGVTQVAPAIGIQMDQGVFRFTLSGYVTMLQNTTRFIGLRFGTDGAFSIQGANFISRPIVIIPNYARLASARITNGALELVGDVKLPAPFTQGAPQELLVRIMPDGRVSGGGKIVIISEREGLATAQTKLDIGVATFHLRHLDVAIDVANADNTAVSVVADIYVQNRQSNLLRFGAVNGATVTPGLRVAVSGAVTFGGLAMPNPITIDLDPVKVTFSAITSTETPTGWALAVNGGLGLKLDGASGSLAFTNLGFTSEGEIRLGQAVFNGGTFTIQEKVKVTVGRIAWSDSDTSIYVPVRRPPSPSGEIFPDSALLAVSSFVDLGASVEIADAFSGGVDRLLVYVAQADNTTHFLIDNLAISLPGVIQFNASMNYDQLVDGFDFTLTAQGLLLSAYRFGMVGVMGQRAGVFRAGLFLRTSVTVPIVPGIVMLTEVGGGVFVNPTANDLMLVKNIAGLNGPAANKVGMPPAKLFAVMLYAGIEVAGSNGVSAAQGRAMVTITDKAFQINASATFFKMKDQITGDLAIQVGWDPQVYVKGAIALQISVPKTVTGLAEIEFFAGGNVFAVKGNVSLVVIEFITASAEVIIVPSGFTANLSMRIEKVTSVVGVSLGGNLRVYSRPSTNDLGAYLKVYGAVTAFGITGRIDLIGALVLEPELAIYGQASAQIVGIDALKVEVWVQYTSTGLKAGLGHNAELAAVIANAEQIARDLEAEADRILAGIDAAAMARARTPITVSQESLAAAFRNFQRWNWLELLFGWGLFRLGEGSTRGGLLPNGASDPYVNFYELTLTNADAAADTAIVRQLREEAEQKIAVINSRRAAITQRIGELRLELAATEAAAEFVPPADPVSGYSFGNPSFVAGPGGAMTLVGAPTFDLDEPLAAAAEATMTTAQATTTARPELLQAQLVAVEAGLARVIAATTASDPESFASYARLHSEAVEAVEHQHAANIDFRMRRRTWAQSKLDTLAVQKSGLEQRLGSRLLVIPQYQQTALSNDAVRRRAIVSDLDALAKHRATFLSAWSRDPTILAMYGDSAAPWRTLASENAAKLRADPNDGGAAGQLDLATAFFQTQAVNYGLQAWWGVANAGLAVSRDGANALVTSAEAAAVPVIRAMRDMHARITSDLASLNERQADLYGTLYDLYAAYLLTYGAADVVGQAYTARKAVIAQMLTAPSVSNPRVTVTNFGYLSSISTTWTGSHVKGVYEYLIQDGEDSLFTIGAQGQARRWMYTTNPAGGTVPRNQNVMVRGGAGLTASTLTPYSVVFRQGSASNPVTQVAVPPVDLSPPSVPIVTLVDLVTRANSTGELEYWTVDSSKVLARWTATDAQSAIAEYEYRLVSWPLPTTTTSSTSGTFGFNGFGVIRVERGTALTQWASAGGRTSMTIQGLNLPANRLLYVEVRAKNGAGLTGWAGTSATLRYDPTPPVFPAGSVLAPPPAPSGGFYFMPFGFVTGTYAPLLPVCGNTVGMKGAVGGKVWSGQLVMVTPDNAIVGAATTAQMVLGRPTATDPETGIAGYFFRFDSVAPGPTRPSDLWSDILETGATFTARGPNFAYGRPRWITLVALNQAGRRSAALTYGPVTIPDATPPTAPAFCGDFAGGGFIAYMITPSTDPETGVRGYQMRVRGPNGSVVRDFPAGATVDWPATQATAGRGIRLPIIPAIGGLHTVELRAVSGLGVVGALSQSGTMNADVTPPPVAGVTSAMSFGRVVVTLTLANDPESGLAGVDIAVGTDPTPSFDPKDGGGTILIPYATYSAVVGISKPYITVPSGVVLPPGAYVYVRVRNGAGIVSALTTARIQP